MIKTLKNKSTAIKTLICVLLLTIATLTAVFAVNRTENAYAAANELEFEKTATEYYSGKDGYTLRVFVSDTLYENYALKITYQRVKLNFYNDNVTTYKGECTDKTKDGKPVYEVLDAKDTVAISKKDELKESDSVNPSRKYFFELKTNVNCAYIFSVIRTPYSGSENDVTYQTAYVRKIDDAAPTILSTNAVLVGSDKVRIIVKFGDHKVPIKDETGKTIGFKDPGCARSGVTEIEVKDATTNTVVEKKQLGGAGKDGIVSYDFIGEFNRNYDIKLTDGVKNERVKRVGYKNDVYNADAETVYINATTGEGKDQLTEYSVTIQNAVNSAYENYFTVTRNVNATDEEKKAALKKFNDALKLYTDAKARYDGGHKINLTIKREAEGTAFSEFEAIGFENALAALMPIGDNVTVTLTGTYYSKPNMPKDTDEMLDAVKSDVKNPTEAYRITIRTVSESEGEKMTRLTGTAEIEFNAGSYKKAVAILENTSISTGRKTYEKCNITRRQTESEDDVVSITVPNSAGVVTLLVERNGGNKMYWLFSLAALPLVIGGAMLAYAFGKMKKIKEQAATSNREGGRPPRPRYGRQEKNCPRKQKEEGQKEKINPDLSVI